MTTSAIATAPVALLLALATTARALPRTMAGGANTAALRAVMVKHAHAPFIPDQALGVGSDALLGLFEFSLLDPRRGYFGPIVTHAT